MTTEATPTTAPSGPTSAETSGASGTPGTSSTPGASGTPGTPVMDEERTAYQEALRGWLADAATSAAVRGWLETSDRRTFHELLVRDGWSGVGLDEAIGGEGGGLLEAALTAEELARVAAPSSIWLATQLAAPALASAGEVARAAVAGEGATWAVDCGRRPGPGAPGLLSVRDGRVTGEVPRVLAGAEVRWLVVPVVSVDGSVDESAEEEEAPPDAVVLHLVDLTASGVTARSTELLDRSRSVADIRLEDAPAQLLSGDGALELARAASRAAVLVAADALGASEQMLDLAVDYSRQRVQFGVPIGSFQAVKHAAATMLVGVEAARSVILRVAAGDDREPSWPLEAAATKAQVTGEAGRAADSALTLHGAIGYTWEHDLQLFYKRAKLDEHLFGPVAEWNGWIADRLPVV